MFYFTAIFSKECETLKCVVTKWYLCVNLVMLNSITTVA